MEILSSGPTASRLQFMSLTSQDGYYLYQGLFFLDENGTPLRVSDCSYDTLETGILTFHRMVLDKEYRAPIAGEEYKMLVKRGEVLPLRLLRGCDLIRSIIASQE